MRKAVIDRINNCVNTDTANLSNLDITDNEIQKIMEKVKQLLPNVSVINLDGNHLNDKGAFVLAKHLYNFHHLAELSIQYNNIGKEGAISLFSLKKELSGLNILFHGNKIYNVSEMADIENYIKSKGPVQ